jgi:hypothetical protein
LFTLYADFRQLRRSAPLSGSEKLIWRSMTNET